MAGIANIAAQINLSKKLAPIDRPSGVINRLFITTSFNVWLTLERAYRVVMLFYSCANVYQKYKDLTYKYMHEPFIECAYRIFITAWILKSAALLLAYISTESY